MKTEIVNFKTDPVTKKQARLIVDKMGFSLGTVLNAFLKHLIQTKTIHFSSEPQEEPSAWLINELEQSEKDRKAGWVSPGFTDTKNMVAWLKNPNRRYANGKTDHGN